jgi:thermitase
VPVGQEQARVAAYARNPNVLFAEVDVIYRLASHGTSDPLVGQQWSYHNTGQTGGTPDADIDAFEAWHSTEGSSAVVIAILDTGIDQDHPDLGAKLVGNQNHTTSATVDDRYGHGTHVAGSAAAVTNNATGVAGTCPRCALLNVKVVGDDGVTQASWVASGVRAAADAGAAVVSMSIGADLHARTLETAINYAWGRGRC